MKEEHKDVRIKSVKGRQVFDSRGRPTVEAEVRLQNGVDARACAPSGASTGRHEALELRDGDVTRYAGLGVSAAVANINGEIARALTGFESHDQVGADALMRSLDGTANWSRLGANAVLPVSLAICRAAAKASSVPLYQHIASLLPARAPSLPMPMVNILSGGAHAGRGMDLQDFLLVPVGARDYREALEWILLVRASAAECMREQGLSTLLADEGGLSPGFARAKQALDLMITAIETAGLRPGEDAAIALDVAASELYGDGRYVLAKEAKSFSGAEMAEYVAALVAAYPIVSVEDALEQDDWDHWTKFKRAAGSIQVVGDDLFVTNAARIREGAARGAANAALIKINQNGTLSGTLDAMRAAWGASFSTVVSARSGETEDPFIADLAAGAGAGQIKIGSVRNSERMAKYNQLLRLAEQDLPFANPFKT